MTRPEIRFYGTRKTLALLLHLRIILGIIFSIKLQKGEVFYLPDVLFLVDFQNVMKFYYHLLLERRKLFVIMHFWCEGELSSSLISYGNFWVWVSWWRFLLFCSLVIGCKWEFLWTFMWKRRLFKCMLELKSNSLRQMNFVPSEIKHFERVHSPLSLAPLQSQPANDHNCLADEPRRQHGMVDVSRSLRNYRSVGWINIFILQ